MKNAAAIAGLLITLLCARLAAQERGGSPNAKPVQPNALATASRAQTLRLGVNNWLFWRKHDNGAYSGADVDIWREIARRCDLQLEYTFLPDLTDTPKRLSQEKALDAMTSLLKNPEREEYLYFIEPPIRTKLRYLTYVRADSNFEIERLADLHGRTVVAPSPVTYAAFDNDPEIKKEMTASWNVQVAADKLLDGRADVLHMCHWQAIWFFKNNPDYLNRLKQTSYIHREFHPNYLVMFKSSPLAAELKDRIGQTVRQMLDDGSIKRIIDSYVPGWWEYYKQ